MSLNVNQTYLQYYQIRLGTLTTNHQIQSNRKMLYTNQVMDTAQKINFYEQQKVLVMATPHGEQIAIKAEYFDLPTGFDPNDPDTWQAGGEDAVYYQTPCQKELYIFKKATDDEYNAVTNAEEKLVSGGQKYIMIPYEHTGQHTISTTSDYTDATLKTGIQDSRILSNKLMSGEYTLVYTNDDFEKQLIRYEDLPFIAEKEDDTAYQEMIEMLEAERYNLQEMEKGVQSEMNTTEVEIQAINSLMESTEKVLSKNTESFKWG